MVRYVVEITRELAARDDVEVHVLTSTGSRPFFAGLIGSSDRVHTLPGLPTAALSAVERYVPMSVLRAVDVVHGTKHLLPAGGRAHKLLTVHDTVHLDRPYDFSASKRLLLRQPFMASVRGADTIVTVSRATADRLASYDLPAARRAQVVPLALTSSLLDVPGVAVDRVAAKRARRRRPLPRSTGKPWSTGSTGRGICGSRS